MSFEEIIEQIKVKPYYRDDAVVIYCADKFGWVLKDDALLS